MDLANDPGKINFLVQVHSSYDRKVTGGIVVLHKLAHLIAEAGHNAYVFCKPEYDHPNIHRIPCEIIDQKGFVEYFQWEGFNYPIQKTVSIYPQVTAGNPFNTAHVARWVLYDTEKVLEDTYSDTDIVFAFGDFKTYRDWEKHKLTIFDYQLDKMYITNTGKRKGFCYVRNKHTPPDGDAFVEKLGATNLSDWDKYGDRRFDFLREHFNQHEYMLTYDQKSLITTLAALCGCKVIILNPGPTYEFSPNANTQGERGVMTPTEYRLKNPIQMYGVAYGWDDIQWANNTIHMVRDHVEALQEIDMKTFNSFIKYWEKKLL